MGRWFRSRQRVCHLRWCRGWRGNRVRGVAWARARRRADVTLATGMAGVLGCGARRSGREPSWRQRSGTRQGGGPSRGQGRASRGRGRRLPEGSTGGARTGAGSGLIRGGRSTRGSRRDAWPVSLLALLGHGAPGVSVWVQGVGGGSVTGCWAQRPRCSPVTPAVSTGAGRAPSLRQLVARPGRGEAVGDRAVEVEEGVRRVQDRSFPFAVQPDIGDHPHQYCGW